MKNKSILRSNEEAKIYKNYYKPSLNIFFFVKSILSVLISGSSPVASHGKRK